MSDRSPVAARRHGVRVVSYDQHPRPGATLGWQGGDAWRQQAIAGRRDLIPDTACFRIDFDRWLKRLTERDRAVVTAMTAGERTTALGRRFGISGCRVSQLRRKFEQDWRAFQGEAA